MIMTSTAPGSGVPGTDSVNTMRHFAIVGLMGFVGTLSAQWPLYPADGKVSLTAPAPRTADGKPDLSGVWDRGIAPPVPGVSAPPSIKDFSGVPQAGPELIPESAVGAWRAVCPCSPGAAQLRSERFATNSKEHPDAHCLPLHPVQLHSHPQPRKIVETPGLIPRSSTRRMEDCVRSSWMGVPLPSGRCTAVVVWLLDLAVGTGDTLVVETTRVPR